MYLCALLSHFTVLSPGNAFPTSPQRDGFTHLSRLSSGVISPRKLFVNSHMRMTAPSPAPCIPFALCILSYTRSHRKSLVLNLSPQMASKIPKNRKHDLGVILSSASQQKCKESRHTLRELLKQVDNNHKKHTGLLFI